MLRKHPKLLKNNPALARELVRRRYQNGLGPLRGYTAEALFVDKNPQWGYVGKANATQNDVYRWRPGHSAPFTGQIKYHDSGNAAQYARDMVLDHRAHRFFIPDDHVEPTKAHLSQQARAMEARGDAAAAKRLWRDFGRVRPIGATSEEIRAATREAAKNVTRERYSTYIAVGAGLALAMGPAVTDLLRGDVTANVAARHATKALSLGGAGYAADWALSGFRDGALRGTTRGNFIVGTVIAITQTTWLLYEHGWAQAFYSPEFYEETVGGISALALAMAVGSAMSGVAIDASGWGPLIIAGTSMAAGTIGYFGGKQATRILLEVLAPEMLRAQETQRLVLVKAQLDDAIAAMRTMPPSGALFQGG